MKSFIYLLTCLIILVSVQAGEIRKIDFEGENSLIVNIPFQDGVEFDMFNGRHVITIDKITPKGVDLNVFLFVEGNQSIYYVTVKKERSIKLDFDRDGKGEIYIKLNEVREGKIASLLFLTAAAPENELPHRENEGISDVTGSIVNSPYSTAINKLFGFIIGVLVLAFIIILIINRAKKQS